MAASKHESSEANTASTTNSCSLIIGVTSFTIHEESSRVAQKNSRFCANSFDVVVESFDCEQDCMRYGLGLECHNLRQLTDGHALRYCVPMDNQRPELDLKFYNDICPDRNGTPLRTLMIISNASL